MTDDNGLEREFAQRASIAGVSAKSSGPDSVLEHITGIVRRCDYDPRRDMHFIDPRTVLKRDWVMHGGTKRWIPVRISSICGWSDCARKIQLFSVKPQYVDQRSACLESECGDCRKSSKFYAIGLSNHQTLPWCESVWQHPIPEFKALSISSGSLLFEIFDAYEEAVGCFNDGRWRAVVTECGRALEGITQDKFVTKEQREALAAIAQSGELDVSSNASEFRQQVAGILFGPLLDLTKVIRLGRLTGAHFNLKRKADQEIAREVLDLTEYVIQYFYTLQPRAEALRVKIDEMEISNASSEPESS